VTGSEIPSGEGKVKAKWRSRVSVTRGVFRSFDENRNQIPAPTLYNTPLGLKICVPQFSIPFPLSKRGFPSRIKTITGGAIVLSTFAYP
jgi:hypothetical protein